MPPISTVSHMWHRLEAHHSSEPRENGKHACVRTACQWLETGNARAAVEISEASLWHAGQDKDKRINRVTGLAGEHCL